jgi:transcriptional regulator with XRE-family HTH domain
MTGIQIGQLIKEQVKRRRLKAAQFASLLNVSEPNIYKIYQRESIDTGLLQRICLVLDHNFFEHYYRQFSISSRESERDFFQKENELLRQLLKEKEEKYHLLAERSTRFGERE